MYVKYRYSNRDMILWTRWEILAFLVYAAVIAALYDLAGLTFIHVPWTPIAVVGTAVAFILGFQNNSAYGRIWEARKIWGGIVNTSRTWGMKTKDMVSDEYCDDPVPERELQEHRRRLVFRHIAWLTALRHAMRQPRTWETFEMHRTNREWSDLIHIPERFSSLHDDLAHYLEEGECDYAVSKKNAAAAILFLQSSHLRKLKEKGLLWEFAFLELENVLEEMFTLQGKSERIKNFPYPRQYATLSYVFTALFIILLPIGIIPQFATIGENFQLIFPVLSKNFVWMGVPFCVIVSWVFATMQRIGTTGENPFEGSANDVPISTISRGIEIDLRQLLDEDEKTIPDPFPEQHNVQM